MFRLRWSPSRPHKSRLLLTLGLGLLALPLITPVVTTPVDAIFNTKDGPFPREGECNLDDPFFDVVRHKLGRDRNIGPDTLKGVAIPEPSNLADFVRDRDAAIVLGKALFWDMQVGSDGIQACATCHFRAGADPRSKNQLSPGGVNDTTGVIDILGANAQLQASHFPLHEFADPFDRTSAVLRSVDDVVSSQGVIFTQFDSVRPGHKADRGTLVPDPVFAVGASNTRRVEPRNTPTMINAVFNHRNFWDGRADNIFNGVNPFGARDPDARVLRAEYPTQMSLVQVRIDTASLASQAVGPPESNFEMGFINRKFRDIGKRLVSAVPLKNQRIHPDDSVLGGYVRHSGKGLDGQYGDWIRAAFQPVWWDSSQIVVIDGDGNLEIRNAGGGSLAENEYSMIEHNFSLFFGLAVQMYEATLVSDDAKVDQHFDNIRAGGPGTLSAIELFGMDLFKQAACADCHSGPEFSSAVIRSLVTGFDNPNVTPTFQPPEQIERMVIGTCDIAVYDQGFYNLGVRPFAEDLGLGNLDPFGNPLSIATLKTMDPAAVPSQELLTLHFAEIGDLGVIPSIELGEPTAVAGAFKIPSLRNVALTAPYFHNGGKRTLREVVEFYNRGGDFHDHVGAGGVLQTEFMDLGVGRLELTSEEIDAIVAFLETLTDQRVVDQAAPFDHPELLVPNGHDGDHLSVDDQGGEAKTEFLRVAEVGRNGGPLPAGFLEDSDADSDADSDD